ncbi:MAG: carboxypeptidase regulatory-like domain-containing protein [Rikenellaceae bacterium]
MKHLVAILFVSIIVINPLLSAELTYDIRGKVIDSGTRKGIPYVAVSIASLPQKGSVSADDGSFVIEGVEGGVYNLYASSIGYAAALTDGFQLSASTPAVVIEMSPGGEQIDSIVVIRSLFRRIVESPVSMRRVGVQQIEKSPGANRDISRVVQSYPGIAFSPAAYRNDLIVRGGSPSENSFYMDGVEIPNINHFSTEGASGGPVSLINADLIREMDFYSGSFPADKMGAMSSIMDIELRDGDTEQRQYKATLGAAEVALSGDGYLGDKCDYIFSIRQSYLQMLFGVLGLPFLPNFIDGLIKVNYNLSPAHKVSFLALVGIDDMELNEEGTSSTAEYILGYLPQIKQQSYTFGAVYNHFGGDHSERLSLSYSALRNENIKYFDNDDSSADNLWYRYLSRDGSLTLRSDNSRYLDRWRVRFGGDLSYNRYSSNYFRQVSSAAEIDYDDMLITCGYGLYASGGYTSASDRFTASIGARVDGNSYSSLASNPLRQLSPRLAASYLFDHDISLSASAGIYYQMPPSSALSYEQDGVRVNSDLTYSSVRQATLGLEWQPSRGVSLSMEGFYKSYSDLPVSLETGVPLADEGTDYGVIGAEALVQSGVGRAYGAELMAQWQILDRLSLVGSLTLFKSEYASQRGAEYVASSWDNRYIFNGTASYNFRRGWSVGAKLSSIGGAPYTPYDLELTSQVEVWDSTGQPQVDYDSYHSERLPSYTQLDLRVDKSFYFKKWMLGLYLDIQNALGAKYRQADLWISTGEYTDASQQYYVLESLENSSGTILPTFGLTARF